VNLTQGFTLAALDALNRAALMSQRPITYALVRQQKRQAIEQQSKGILEELEPRYGFEVIGGLRHLVDYLRAVVTHLRERRLEAVPKGILLAGPPGTGKTLVAEALAKEAGFNLVRLGDVRSMWVGESERNLSHVLRVLLALEPVVVFVDEIDQALGARDRGLSGDSGVSARIFGRLLNFMGKNEHRGRVLWMAATNRPDLLDEAMIRRFDRVFPFFVPGAAERDKILRALPAITGLTYTPDIDLRRPVERTQGLTGSALEMIARRAAELASGAPVGEEDLLAAIADYKPNHDPDTYLLQSLLALGAANLYSALPAEADLPDEIRDVVTQMRQQGSAAPLHERLRALRAKTSSARLF
jgi:transitional endoplasmic reticulum ATPase